MSFDTAQLAICNDALALLSDIQIASTSDTTSKQYTVCNQFYETVKDEVFAEHAWNELIVMDEIIEDDYPPLFSFSHRYALPSNCVRVISVGNDTDRVDSQSDSFYRVEGGYIYTNYGITPPGWTTGTRYMLGKYVTINGSVFSPVYAHTSAGTMSADDYDNDGHLYSAGDYIVYNDDIYICVTGAPDYSYTSTTEDTAPSSDTTNWTKLWNYETTDNTILRLRYIDGSIDETAFSKTLRACIVHSLAIKIVARITGDNALKGSLVNEYEQIVARKARTIDASQGKVRYPWKSWLLTSRYRSR